MKFIDPWDERPVQYSPSIRAFFAEVFAAGNLVGVVSLNYDLLIEKVLRPYPMRRPPSPGFHYGGLPTPRVCVGRGSLPWRGARPRTARTQRDHPRLEATRLAQLAPLDRRYHPLPRPAGDVPYAARIVEAIKAVEGGA